MADSHRLIRLFRPSRTRASSNQSESERHIPSRDFAIRCSRDSNASIEVDVGVVTTSPLRDFQGHIEQFFKSPGQFAEFGKLQPQRLQIPFT